MGTLYVVGLPASNLEDVTQRALRVLREVGLIIAQDVLHAQDFLAYHSINTPLVACSGNKIETRSMEKPAGCELALETLVHGDVALLSTDAPLGDAASSWRLVRAAVERGFAIVSVPGPSATVTALVTSGLPADAYLFLGSLPQRITERRRLLASIANERRTLVAFETFSCLQSALCDVAEILGNRRLALLPFWANSSEAWRGTVKEALAHLEGEPLRAEWALVISGSTGQAARWSEEQVRSELKSLLADGMGRKEAARRIAEVSGWRRREVYRLAGQSQFHV
jgi:16S rRNA (cytidine1402-2'-O)-methyltransferase